MKRLIFFLALILSFSGCSEFQHMHYRHVKKVPAKGFVEARSGIEKNFIVEGKTDRAIDPLQTVEQEIVNENVASAVPVIEDNPAYIIPPVVKKQSNDPAPKKTIGKKSIKIKKPDFHRKRVDGTVVLILFFLFLGVLLMLLGGAIIVGAFYGFTLWLFLLGLAIFFLGLLPFLGLLSFAFGRGNNDDVPAFKENKRSFFPDHEQSIPHRE